MDKKKYIGSDVFYCGSCGSTASYGGCSSKASYGGESEKQGSCIECDSNNATSNATQVMVDANKSQKKVSTPVAGGGGGGSKPEHCKWCMKDLIFLFVLLVIAFFVIFKRKK